MRLVEARRITGLHPLLPGPGAAGEWLHPQHPHADTADQAPETPELHPLPMRLDLLRQRLDAGAGAMAMEIGPLVTRPHRRGVSLAFLAPIDLLDAAVDLLEWAVGEAPLTDLPQPTGDPHLRELWAATAHLARFVDDDGFTLGLGRAARTFAPGSLPTLAEAEGTARVPFAFVTGTNGKTTTTRMLAAMAESAGLTSGYTSSDGVVVGRTWTATGDWTGPGAARSLLRDPHVDFAVLETARGGLMRRGLALTGADAAAVTNISDDHLGEWGLDSLADLAWAKLTVAHAVKPQGVIVIRKADPSLAAALPSLLAARPDLSVCTFADADPTADAWAQDGTLFLREADQITPILPETEIPLTMGGLVRPMVENALCASLLARALGLPIDAIRGGLRALTPDPERSKGRMNRLRLPNGARALLDFAHNPAGIRALQGLAHAPREGRLLCLAGQAGDREDAQLETYAEALATLRPDLVLLKELPHYRRGRAEGEIRTILRRCLLAHGLRPDQLIDEPEELDAVRRAIDLSAPGDLLFLLIHEEPEATLDLLLSAGATLG